MCNSPLHFELLCDSNPCLRTCVLIDVSALRAQASRALNIDNNFKINYELLLSSIADKLGPLLRTDLFLSVNDVNLMPVINKFAQYAASLGCNPHICTFFKNERVLKNDPDYSNKLNYARARGLEIVEESHSWKITNGGKPKITAKSEMAAAIVNATAYDRFDCIVLGTNDSLFVPIIQKYIINRNINCGLIYIQGKERPPRHEWTLSPDLLNLFNYRLRFDSNVVSIMNGNEA